MPMKTASVVPECQQWPGRHSGFSTDSSSSISNLTENPVLRQIAKEVGLSHTKVGQLLRE
jgi:hypothetical protein